MNLCEVLVSLVFEFEFFLVYRVSVFRGNIVYWFYVYSGYLRGFGLDVGYGVMVCINYMGV